MIAKFIIERKDIPMVITKKEFIQKLYEIEEQNQLNLEREVQKVIRNEQIPLDVIKLINKYDKKFFQIYSTYNHIYLSREKNPLYKNLKRTTQSLEEKAVTMSSLVTKILITATKITDPIERKNFVTTMGLKEFNDALTDFYYRDDAEQMLSLLKQVKELLEILYKD